MSWIDWVIVFLPLSIAMVIAFRVRRYVRSVSDFLTGGRVAGRYVVAVASGETSMGLITVVALFEMYYRSGFAVGFWSSIGVPLTLVAALTGFAIYRYRETRAMTMAQFYEIRYSKRFRVFAGLLAWASGVLNYALFPAVGGRFLVSYCELPVTTVVLGWHFPTFGLVMAAFLSVAVVIVLLGGQLTTMVHDCMSGIFSYAMYATVVISILAIFSWDQMQSALLARPEGESMLNPFDTYRLTDFNVFFVIVGVISGLYNIISWQGAQGYNAAAASPHEQKMGMVLSVWRSSFSYLMVILLSVAAWTYMNHADFSQGAESVRHELASTINLSTEATTNQIRDQMLVPVAVRHLLPAGVVGAFCAAMVLMLISGDTTYLHSWGSILVQDVVLPLRKKPFTPRQQIWMLRLSVTSVALFAFIWSLYFNQVTYILMLFALTGAVYLGGAGAVILGGLYWKRGTAAGAWAAMLTGSGTAVVGFACTQFWASLIYPYVHTNWPQVLGAMTSALNGISAVLPFMHWQVGPDRFPISGQEIYFLSMFLSVFMYIGTSILTSREPFDLDRMLHRGKYRRSDEQAVTLAPLDRPLKNWKKILLGFDEEFTRGDKILSGAVFGYCMSLFAVWLGVVAWNSFVGRFSSHTWANYFWFMNIGLALVVSAVTSIWFTVGGTRDLVRMFRRLATMERNVLDDGRVLGHVNAEDVAFVPEISMDQHPPQLDRPDEPKQLVSAPGADVKPGRQRGSTDLDAEGCK